MSSDEPEATFTVDEARAMMPEIKRRESDYVRLRADLAELSASVNDGSATEEGSVAEVKALEARLNEALEWFRSQGIQVKGFAPLLIDFPALVGGQQVLLCWLEGEAALDWYHDPRLGFMGRRPIADLG